MKALFLMIFITAMLGCHHQTQPQGFDQAELNTIEKHQAVPAESLMADFAHRY